MSLIKTKFVEDNAITDIKMRLRNNLSLRSRNSGNTVDVDILKLNTADIIEMLREISMVNQKITNLADPTAALDAANKQYVDAVVSGLSDPKDATRAATALPLPAVTLAGLVLTANINGALPAVDGIGLSVGERVLVKNQVSALENGIYVVSDLGSAGTPFILTRSNDADNSGDVASAVTQGMYVPVAEGTLNGALGFMLTSPDPLVIGTSALNFTQFGEVIVAGQGLTKTGQTLTVDAGNGLGFSGNALVVLTDADLVDGSTKIKLGKIVGSKNYKEVFTISSSDITNGYVDFLKVVRRDSVSLFPFGGPEQEENVDFTMSYLGGVGGKSRLLFAGDITSLVAVGDKLIVKYDSLDY